MPKYYRWGIVPRLKKVFKECRRTDRGRFDFYDYLDEIHRFVSAMSMIQRAQQRQSISLKYLGNPPRKGASFFLVLIKATASGKIDAHSRWARALEFCDQHQTKIKSMGFREFAESKGGIAGMANRTAKKDRVVDSSPPPAIRTRRWED